jgi:hypothetical protein
VIAGRATTTLLLALLTAAAPDRVQPILVQKVTAIDPRTGHITPHTSIVIRGDRIDSVGLPPTLPPPNALTIDGVGLFALPGLWDMHTHVNDDGAWALPLAVASGVLGLRDMGAELENVERWRRWIDAGEIVPAMRVTGPILTGAVDDPDRKLWRILDRPGAVHAVERLRDAHVDHVKVHDWLTRDVWRAVVDRARVAGIPVVGHVPARVDAVEVIAAGQRSIEHLGHAWGGLLLDVSADERELKGEFRQHMERSTTPHELAGFMSGERWDRIVRTYSTPKAAALARRFKERGTFLCPTLHSFAWLPRVHLGRSFAEDPRLAYLPPDRRAMLAQMITVTDAPSASEIDRAARVYDAQVRLLGAIRRAGGVILAGTDYAQYPLLFPGLSLHDELSTLVAAGLTPLEAVRAATSNAGLYLNDERIGCLAVGCAGDLVLLKRNPLEHIANISAVHALVLRGHYISPQDREALLATARAVGRMGRARSPSARPPRKAEARAANGSYDRVRTNFRVDPDSVSDGF